MADNDKLAKALNQKKASDWSARNEQAFGGMMDINQFLPVTGDIQSGVQATQDLKNKKYASALLNGVGLLPFVPSLGGVLKNTIEHHPFIGYITKDGKHEMFNEKLAKEADYHHSFLVKDIDAYDDDNALRFVRNGSENRYSLLGNSAIDPYHPESKKQISTLSKELQLKGADPNAPFVIENMGFSKDVAPYQNKEIGKLSDWYTLNK
jgi:hypothetical protein